MQRSSTLIYIASTVVMTGCARTSATTAGDRAARPTETDCVRTSLVRDWEVLDQRNLIVYESGDRLDRVVVDRTIPEDCSVAAVDELTDEQAEELKQRAEFARARR